LKVVAIDRWGRKHHIFCVPAAIDVADCSHPEGFAMVRDHSFDGYGGLEGDVQIGLLDTWAQDVNSSTQLVIVSCGEQVQKLPTYSHRRVSRLLSLSRLLSQMLLVFN
jgi:hypothetical protein